MAINKIECRSVPLTVDGTVQCIVKHVAGCDPDSPKQIKPGDQVTITDTQGVWEVIGFEEGMVRCKQEGIELCFDFDKILLNATTTPG